MKNLEKSQQPGVESPYFTLEGAADHACCSIRTVQRWLKAGQLSRYGNGRRVLIHQRELEALLSPTPASEEAA